MDVFVKDLVIRFPGMEKPLLEIPEATVKSGERLLIRGASGSGKTSFLHTLTGLLDPAAGDVRLGGKWIARLNERQRCALRRESVGFIFQRLNLLEHLTAVENVQLGVPGKSVTREAAVRALDRVGMARHADSLAFHLSLGEQQRVAVARVLAASPGLIIADEPTSSLDQTNAERVMDALFEAARGGTLLVATHDDRIKSRFARAWTVEGGRLS